MAAVERKNYSSYARILLTFSSFGRLFNANQKQPTTIMGLPANIISNTQLKQILDDPINQDIKTVMKMEARKIELGTEIETLQSNIKLQKIFIDESLKKLIPARDASQEEKESVKNTKQFLEDQFRKLNAFDADLKKNITDYQNIDQEIAEKSKNQEKVRDDFRKNILKELSGEFDKWSLEGEKYLNDAEVSELLRVDSWEDVIKRFQDLRIEWPKHIDQKNPSYRTYFELKSYLSVQSALSRNFLTHDYRAVMSHMKKLDDIFKNAEEKGKVMYKEQEKFSEDLISNQVEPALNNLKNRQNTLTQMKEQGEKHVQAVAPAQLEAIQKNTQTRAASIEPETIGPHK